jgi:hypothetical protein
MRTALRLAGMGPGIGRRKDWPWPGGVATIHAVNIADDVFGRRRAGD